MPCLQLMRARRSADTSAEPATPVPTRTPLQDTLERFYFVGPLPIRVRSRETPLPLLTPPGIQPEDVRSGGFNTCYLLASIQAVLVQIPRARQELVVPHGDDIAVQYYDKAHSEPRTLILPPLRYTFSLFGKRLDLAAQSNPRATVMWPAYLEQAFAFTLGGFKPLMSRSDPSAALTWLTGKPAQTIVFGTSRTPVQHDADIAAHHRRGACVVVHTRKHAYALIGVSGDSANVVLHLLNPVDTQPSSRRVLQRSNKPLNIRGFSYTLRDP